MSLSVTPPTMLNHQTASFRDEPSDSSPSAEYTASEAESCQAPVQTCASVQRAPQTLPLRSRQSNSACTARPARHSGPGGTCPAPEHTIQHN